MLILLEKLYKLNELIGFFEITFVTIALQLKGQSNNFYFLEAFYFQPDIRKIEVRDMNDLRITPCKREPQYKTGEIITIKPRKTPNKPEDYLVLRVTPNNRGVFALPISGKEQELNIPTITALNGAKNIQTTGVLNYVA